MQSKRATKKGSLMALVVAVSALLAGVALADKGGKANANADFGQSMAAEARAKGEAMKQDGQDTAAEASDRMKEERDKAARKAEKEQRRAEKKAEKADRKAKQARKDADDRIDVAAQGGTDAGDDAEGMLDGMTAPE